MKQPFDRLDQPDPELDPALLAIRGNERLVMEFYLGKISFEALMDSQRANRDVAVHMGKRDAGKRNR